MRESILRPDTPESDRGKRAWAAVIVLIVATGLRIAHFPAPNEVRDEDDLRYAISGLQLFEGLPPGMKATPNGPQTWLTAGFAAVRAAASFVRPPDDWGTIPVPVRFYFAVDKSLFDTYADLSSLRFFLLTWQLLVAIAAVYFAFRFGWRISGAAGGWLLGGLVACLPLYVEYAAMTRAYSDAWSFSWIAIGLFAWPASRRAAIGQTIAYGLAVASRIDMLLLAPVFVLLHFLCCDPTTGRWKRVLGFAAGSAAVAYIAAPWMLTHLVGLLRVIATVRVTGQMVVDKPRQATFIDLAWNQGLGLILLGAAAASLVYVIRGSWPNRLLALYNLALLASAFVGPYQPTRYHGAVLISAILVATIATTGLPRRGLGTLVAFVALALALPLGHSIQLIRATHKMRVNADVVGWVEKNIAADTNIYLVSAYEFQTILPTSQSADELWKDVTDEAAWRRKFQRGLNRFQLQADRYPRAFSEDNLALDRAHRRRWFILGSAVDATRPRYAVHVYQESPTFGAQDVFLECRTTGGIVVVRGALPAKEIGVVRQQWLAADGSGVFIVEVPKTPAAAR